MKKLIMLAAAAVLLLGGLPSEAAAQAQPAKAAQTDAALTEPVVVAKSDGMQSVTVTVPVNGTIQLRLPENPSTGYQWDFQVLDADYVAVIGDEFFYPESSPQMVGASGLRVLTLQAVSSGSTMVKLAHWRSWEGLSSRIDKFVLNIDITAAEKSAE